MLEGPILLGDVREWEGLEESNSWGDLNSPGGRREEKEIKPMG